jgi:hypothetical protein
MFNYRNSFILNNRYFLDPLRHYKNLRRLICIKIANLKIKIGKNQKRIINRKKFKLIPIKLLIKLLLRS